MAAVEQIWDPLRKKMVALTPEERVRQWFITVLRDSMKVPKHMMMSEVGLKYGQGLLKKEYRADILVYDRSLKPLMLVECKRPEVELNVVVIEQVLRYNMVLDVTYIVITNGNSSRICRRNNGKFEFLLRPPTYSQMLEYSAARLAGERVDAENEAFLARTAGEGEMIKVAVSEKRKKQETVDEKPEGAATMEKDGISGGEPVARTAGEKEMIKAVPEKSLKTTKATKME